MLNDLPNLKEEDQKDYRFSHLHKTEVENYDLVVVYHKPVLSREKTLNFLKLEGIL
jgi:hypothetical protein